MKFCSNTSRADHGQVQVGPSGWVAMVLDRRPDWDAVASLVREAYLHVATAKLRARLEGKLPRR